MVHIDFGFILSNSPGNLGFEAAPFKFPAEYLEVLGGLESVHYREFKEQFHAGFEAARKHCGRIISQSFRHATFQMNKTELSCSPCGVDADRYNTLGAPSCLF